MERIARNSGTPWPRGKLRGSLSHRTFRIDYVLLCIFPGSPALQVDGDSDHICCNNTYCRS